MKHVIILPDLGQTTSEAKIVSWLKNPGDKLAMGEPLLEVETDKATMEVETYVGGYLRKCLAGPGDLVAASSPVAILTDTANEDFEEVKIRSALEVPVVVQPGGSHAHTIPSSGPLAAVPAARVLAKQLGLDLSVIPPSGPRGLITKADVERFVSQVGSPTPARALPTEKALGAMAVLTSTSKSTIPHFYVTMDLDIAAAEEWRVQWNQTHPELQASVNDYLVRAASAALADSPRLRIRMAEGKYELQSFAHVMLVMGGDDGLTLVPVADPHAGEFETFLARFRSLLSSARAGRIQATPDQERPVLAISNLGMFAVREFSAIIPPGCNAILAAGAIRDQVVWREGGVGVAKLCSVTVSADHRVVDGITVAKFLERLQWHLNSL